MINLLPRKEFTISVRGKEYSGKFGTYSMKLFCSKKGIKLSEIEKLFPKDSLVEDILDNAIDLILSAIEYKTIIDRKPFDLRPVDFYVAIDDGEYKDNEIMKVLNHSGDEEKNAVLENPPTGINSSDISMQPEGVQTSSGA